MTKDLTTGSPLKLIITFTFPAFLGMLFQQFYNVVDTIIVGKLLGIGPLAGVGATGSLNFMVLGFCMGICNGFAIPVAQKFGAGDQVELRKFVANSLWLVAIIALVLTVPVCVYCRPILRVMNTPEDVFEYAYQYIFIIFLGIPAALLYNILAAILRSLGDSKTPVLFLALSSVLNIGLDIISIKLWGMGVDGTAMATVISQGVSGVICFFYMKKRFTVLQMSREERRPDGAKMKRLCYMGIPMGLQYSITAIGSILLQTAVNGLGAVSMAAVAASGKVTNLFATPYDAMGTMAATYAGQNLGAGKLDRVHHGVKDCCILGVAYSLAALVVMYFLGAQMTALFLDSKDVASSAQILPLARQLLVTNAAFYIPLLGVNLFRFTIQGLGYSNLAVIAGVSEMIARGAVAALVSVFGFTAVCYASPAAWVLADCFLLPAYFVCMKRRTKEAAAARE